MTTPSHGVPAAARTPEIITIDNRQYVRMPIVTELGGVLWVDLLPAEADAYAHRLARLAGAAKKHNEQQASTTRSAWPTDDTTQRLVDHVRTQAGMWHPYRLHQAAARIGIPLTIDAAGQLLAEMTEHGIVRNTGQHYEVRQ